MGKKDLCPLCRLLFEKTQNALDTYIHCIKAEPEADWELQRRTFSTLYNLIYEAELEDEYYRWKQEV